MNPITKIYNFIENDNMDEALDLLEKHYPNSNDAIISLKQEFNFNEDSFVAGKISEDYYSKKRDKLLIRIDAAMNRIGGKIQLGNKKKKKYSDFFKGQIKFFEREVKSLSSVRNFAWLIIFFYAMGSLVYFIMYHDFYTIFNILFLSSLLKFLAIAGGVLCIEILKNTGRRLEINTLEIKHISKIQ